MGRTETNLRWLGILVDIDLGHINQEHQQVLAYQAVPYHHVVQAYQLHLVLHHVQNLVVHAHPVDLVDRDHRELRYLVDHVNHEHPNHNLSSYFSL